MKTTTHPFVGYLAAVVIASLAFVLIALIYPALSAPRPLSELFAMTLLVFLIVAFITLCTAGLPVLLIYKVAKRFGIDSVWYYVILGALVGVALLSLVLLAGPTWYADPPDPPPLWLKVWASAKLGLPCGAVGGFVFWLGTGRFVKRREISA